MEEQIPSGPQIDTEVGLAGRLARFVDNWNLITSNQIIINWVKGVKLHFKKVPFQKHPPKVNVDHKDKIEMHIKIKEMLSEGVISKCKHTRNGFLSTCFLIKRSSGSKRFILNLKKLNRYLTPPHFKLDDYRSVKNLLFDNYYMAKIDLKDAYFLINIESSSRKFLRFQYNKTFYEFNCMPMGLCTAPYIFTKIFKPVIRKLRSEGIIVIMYLDDLLVIGKEKVECQEKVNRVLKVLKFLGCVINYKKSVLCPSRLCKYLGFNFNTADMVISLPEERILRIKNACLKIFKKKRCKIKLFAQVLGMLVAACPAIKYGWAHTKVLERAKFLALLNSKGNYNKEMVVTAGVISEINWWLSHLENGSFSLRQMKYELDIFSDASLVGWGGMCRDERINGLWGFEEMQNHINQLELLGAFKCLKFFTQTRNGINVLLRLDNTTAISYINRMGGVKFENLNQVTKEIWDYCEKKNLFVFASYINTKENVIADQESRRGYNETEYELSQECFNKIINFFYQPTIDLFATKHNKKCHQFVSWKPDSHAELVDAFTFSWENLSFYAFPPFSLISKVLKKVRDDNAQGILIVPDWPGQVWYPAFQQMLISDTFTMGPDENLLTSPSRHPHPLWKSLTLVAGIISGRPMQEGHFQRRE
ncbi:unnamed protein product [Callosobruchus maculatus]|uniref:Reverse transcriptase domain-containing protein n=1 Tax=Callosobruchus maculatus TaxID=64391 RepID=A0A653BHF4_CALMS|nr:unnamed protein product [Callosobruchus maculatus]